MQTSDRCGIQISNDGLALVRVPFFIRGKYKISKGITKIKSHAFSYCDKITCIVLPDTIRTVEKSAFEGCENLDSIILPDSIKYFDVNAFEDCPQITIYCTSRIAKKFSKAFRDHKVSIG